MYHQNLRPIFDIIEDPSQFRRWAWNNGVWMENTREGYVSGTFPLDIDTRQILPPWPYTASRSPISIKLYGENPEVIIYSRTTKQDVSEESMLDFWAGIDYPPLAITSPELTYRFDTF